MASHRLIDEASRLGLTWGREDESIVSRDEFVAEAMTWLGTPFLHQGERKRLGADCGGLFRGVSVAVGLIPPDYWRRIPNDLRGYPRMPIAGVSGALWDLYMTRIDAGGIQQADVVLICWDGTGTPQHCAIVVPYQHGGLALLHSLPKRGVCMHRLDGAHRRRIVAAYSVPGVA